VADDYQRVKISASYNEAFKPKPVVEIFYEGHDQNADIYGCRGHSWYDVMMLHGSSLHRKHGCYPSFFNIS
jgi:hypothetical protein